MLLERNSSFVDIKNTDDFVPKHIFGCGQCFRWSQDYIGVAGGHVARVVPLQDGVRVLCDSNAFDTFWYDYFDLSRDYTRIRETLKKDVRLHDAITFGRGIRILRQEPWEALCSFIISQCNHIPRIMSIIETLCQMFGNRIYFGDQEYFTFPSAERIAQCTLEDLAPLRAGYRTKYILSAAQRVADGAFDLQAVMQMATQDARRALLGLSGVGNKVADCVLLFGMGKTDAFPIDVWMKRAITEFLGNENDAGTSFGEVAGIAQQYLFHYIRNHNREDFQ